MDITSALVSLHLLTLGSCHLFAEFYFMMHLRSHATNHRTKDNVCDGVKDTCNLVIPLAVSTHGTNRKETRRDLQAVVAPNQANIVGIQTQTIVRANDIGSRGHSHTRADAGFQAHACAGTAALAHVTGLEAAQAAERSLTTLVIAPARAWFDVIQCLVTNM